MRALQYLNKYFSKYKWRILIGLLITILSKLLSLKIPQIIRDSLNVVEDYHNNVVTDIAVVKDQLLINVLIIIGIALFGFTLSYDELARSSQVMGSGNTLPLELRGLTTTVTTPVIYALGTVTTFVSFTVIAISVGFYLFLKRKKGI